MTKKSIYSELKSGIIQEGENLFLLHGIHRYGRWEEQIPARNWNEINEWMERNFSKVPSKGDNNGR